MTRGQTEMCPVPAEVSGQATQEVNQIGSLQEPEATPVVVPVRRFRPGWLRLGMIAAIALAAAISVLVVIDRRVPGPGKFALPPPQQSSTESVQILRFKGTTEAVQARSIQAPLLAGQQVGTLTITRLAHSGTRVKQGDLLVEFDRQAQLRDFIDKQAQSNDENDKVLEEQAKEAAARAKDETEIVQAESSLRKAELEMQKVELLSRIDAEKAQEDLDEAKATMAQLKETFDLKR